MSEEKPQPVFEDEQQLKPAPGNSLIDIAKKDSQATQIMQENPEAAGELYEADALSLPSPEPPFAHWISNWPVSHVPVDDSSQMILAKPEAAGDLATENDNKEPLSQCMLCGKFADHGFFNCPDRERIRKSYSYCMICNEKTDHDTPNCPKATEEVLKNLAYCSICDKNTDHDTFDCPNENGFVWINGVRLINVCDLCREVGHRGLDCPLDSDHDLQYGLGPDNDDW